MPSRFLSYYLYKVQKPPGEGPPQRGDVHASELSVDRVLEHVAVQREVHHQPRELLVLLLWLIKAVLTGGIIPIQVSF